MRKDYPYAFRLANHLFSDLCNHADIIDPQNAKLGLKGLYNVLDYNYRENIMKCYVNFL